MKTLAAIRDELAGAVLSRKGVSFADLLRSNVRTAVTLARFGRRMFGITPQGSTTVADVFERQVDADRGGVAVYFGETSLTYGELDAQANRYAHWARSIGVRPGDVVALLIPNHPDYVAAWIGLAKVGGVAALLNVHLVGQALAHSIAVVRARHVIIAGPALEEAFASAREHLPHPVTTWVQGGVSSGGEDLDAALASHLSERPARDVRAKLRSDDLLCHIYTSGTTGLPKAANISHFRYLGMAAGPGAALDISPRDRTYIPLPLYHAAGGILALGGALTSGASIILAPKFSASRFWADCVEHDATLFQYIGELCRFLLNQPQRPEETAHSIRACIGNGLRPDVWPEFQRRFRLPRVVEFYGSTEGNVALINLDNRVGSVGRVSPALRKLMGVRLLRYDVERDELVRDAQGRYVECEPGEAGEAVGRIRGLQRFEGYTDKEASEKKILRNVFETGDAYFRSGDLLRCDEYGYYYFVDRIGDTFRWRGENVATSEVAEVLSAHSNVRDVCVYGVSVPGNEGRAGMAALVWDGRFDGAALARHVTDNLPAYARPLFVRRLREISMTGTFKHKKADLVREGFDPEALTDPVFFLDASAGAYRRVDRQLYERITSGDIRV